MRIVLILALVAASAGVAAQTPAPAPRPAGTAASPTPEKLEDPPGYSYNPEGRRDPFVSLLKRGAELQRLPAGQRAAGLAGLGTAEVTLKGTVQGRDGFVGILLGSDQKSYLVRPGDKLLDGVVRSITVDAVVILQQVNDPLSLQKQREVRKMLRQTEEAK